jgi:hypothetical protein
VPRVTVESYVYDLEKKQFAILLRVKNPTLGPVRFKLGCVDSKTEIPDTKTVILDSITLTKVSVEMCVPPQKEANDMDTMYPTCILPNRFYKLFEHTIYFNITQFL